MKSFRDETFKGQCQKYFISLDLYLKDDHVLKPFLCSYTDNVQDTLRLD